MGCKKKYLRCRGAGKNDTLRLWGKISKTNYELVSISILNTEVKENIVYKLNNTDSQYGLYRSDKNCFLNTVIYDYGEVKSIDGEVMFTKNMFIINW